jgi:hypothetical protein
MNLKGLLANQTFLYVVLGISIASLFGYIIGQNTNAVLFFVLAGYLTSFFSKNMSVILLVPLVLTNFMFGMNGIREGMKNKDKKDKKDKKDSGDDAEGDDAEGDDAEGGDGNGGASTSLADNLNLNKDKGKKEGMQSAAPSETKNNSEKKKNGGALSGFALNGGNVNLSESMENMAANQEALGKMIETISPIIDQASSIVDKLDKSGITNMEGMLGKMTGIMSGLGVGGGSGNGVQGVASDNTLTAKKSL